MPIIELKTDTTPYDYLDEDDELFEDLVEDTEDDFLEGTTENIRPSEFVEFAIRIPGGGELAPFSFNCRRYLKTIYNSPAKRKLLMAGRQVEKSTLLGNEALAYMAINNYFRCLYVSPSNTQTKVFSRDRIQEPIDTSPILSRFTNGRLLKNVLEKRFINGSQIIMRFAFLNADRCRGLPADKITIDEFQDILLDNVPVIEECASHSDYKLFTYAGTPKSLDNAIEHYWSRFSTQNEWSVPCKHHGTPKSPHTWFWNILGEDNIGDKSLICSRCGKPIFPSDPSCTWVSLNPNPKVEKPYEGYRIPQLMVPWIDFADLKDKQKKYSRAKFYNEVLGRSYDSGTRPLVRGDMIKNSWAELSMTYYRDVIQYCQQFPVFMGLDWGCHDDKTRILTTRGFVYFADLTDKDEVAQFDPETREMTYVKPSVRTIRDWDGNLLHFQSDGVDMLLTPTHRMLFRSSGGSTWEVKRAGSFVANRGPAKFVGSVRYYGEEVETFTLPKSKTSGSAKFKMDDWLELLGYFLADVGICRSFGHACKGNSISRTCRVRVRSCLRRLGLDYLEHITLGTPGGGNYWILRDEGFWNWVDKTVVLPDSEACIPRKFLHLSRRQLRILHDAMMSGSGSEEARSGVYYSRSKKLCESFQELCIHLGMRATLRPCIERGGKRWRLEWSSGDDYVLDDPGRAVVVPYKGKVYCCTVPTGFIVTERNGRVGYQGNTGESSYTVMSLGGYLPFAPEHFTFFYLYRFEGMESEPKEQLRIIKQHVRDFNVRFIGVDYGGGFWPNDELVREFGADKVKKYQWVGNVKKKIQFDPKLGVPRFLCHRTEVMSDMFNAIKRGNVFRYPRWEEFEDPYAHDFLNIFSEYNERMRMNVYKHAPGSPDDTFHSCCFGFLASFYYKARPDVILPSKEVDREQGDVEPNDII